MYSIGDYIEVYELIKGYAGENFARRIVESHADRNPPFIVTARRDEKVVGVAFAWQIADPHDVEEQSGFPGESRHGRYIYWPFVFVKEGFRNNGILPELVLRSLDSCPGAVRLSFHKGKRLHILGLKRLLKHFAGEQEDGRHSTGIKSATGGAGPDPDQNGAVEPVHRGAPGGGDTTGQGGEVEGASEGRKAF